MSSEQDYLSDISDDNDDDDDDDEEEEDIWYCDICDRSIQEDRIRICLECQLECCDLCISDDKLKLCKECNDAKTN